MIFDVLFWCIEKKMEISSQQKHISPNLDFEVILDIFMPSQRTLYFDHFSSPID